MGIRGVDLLSTTPRPMVLPRFETDSTIDLANALRTQGLTAIFDPATRSFQAIATDVDLFFGQAVQQATITVGEQGTVAAAVTEFGLSGTSAPVGPEHQFIADRPFLMIVQENTTGWDLFQTVVRSIDRPLTPVGARPPGLNSHSPTIGLERNRAGLSPGSPTGRRSRPRCQFPQDRGQPWC